MVIEIGKGGVARHWLPQFFPCCFAEERTIKDHFPFVHIPQAFKVILYQHRYAALKGDMLSLLVAAKPRHQALNNAAENVKFEILGSELDIVTETRYLGVQVDTGLV